MTMELVRVNGRWDIWMPDFRAERPEWTDGKGWEAKRLDHIHSTLKPGDVMFYIGAEEGELAALPAQWGARMVLCEANPNVWPHIKAVWEANHLDPPLLNWHGWVDYYTGSNGPSPCGAWIKTWCRCADDLPMIRAHGQSELAERRPDDGLPTATIDAMARWIELDPDVISIDVEGAEGRVLRGAIGVIQRRHPRIYLSFHPEMLGRYGDEPHLLRLWIKSFGYRETLLDYEHEVHFVYE